MNNLYVIVDWRPGDIPTVIGPFTTFDVAYSKALRIYRVDTDELPDGISVVQLNPNPMPDFTQY